LHQEKSGNLFRDRREWQQLLLMDLNFVCTSRGVSVRRHPPPPSQC
jgi:hypothetical protein